MADKENKGQFKIDRSKKLKDLYADETSRAQRQGSTLSSSPFIYKTPTEVRKALLDAISDKATLVDNSEKLYAVNPIYATIINYYANMFTWQYKVTPHKIWTKSKAKAKKEMKPEDFNITYNLMLEVVDGLNIEVKFPDLITKLLTTGSVYITTYLDEQTLTINSLLLPTKYCRTIGQTQFGTYIIQFDCSYFTALGYTQNELNEFLKSWPKEFKKAYTTYLADQTKRWYTLDPHYSTAIMQNERGIPTLFYLYGGILNYEKYQDNELERNSNLLRYLVVHTIPHYQNELLFEVDEVKAIHKSLRKIIEDNDKTKLITTYGEAHVEQVAKNDNADNEILTKAYNSVFNNAGLNGGLFISDSVTALQMTIARDKQYIWRFVQALVTFYNLSINNWLDFKGYEADIDILPISPYTYDSDVKRYKDNATLGVGKVDYIVASGTKQRYIQDMFNLESFLNLSQITPMQTSYTQTAEDRQADIKSPKDSIEPGTDEDSQE